MANLVLILLLAVFMGMIALLITQLMVFYPTVLMVMIATAVVAIIIGNLLND